ncbi:MAG: glycosyltransferase family 2 protein [Patescibacteria group bacterium]
MISIVIPLYNEEESLDVVYNEIIKVVKDHKYEIIFIDDGSTDGSFEILKELEEKNSHVRIFSFRKNQGKAEALMLGFQKSKGDYIITLDADLQDKPSEISKLLNKINEGWELVCGWRKNRNDSFFKIVSSKIFNFMASLFWDLKLHDYNCGLKAYTAEAAKSLSLYGGLHRFVPLLAYQQGFKVTEVSVDHEKRKFGKSKYGFSKLWKDMPDIFTMLFLSRYSKRPMHFFGVVGSVLFLIGTLILGYLSVLRFQGETIGRRPVLFLGMLLVIAGLQVFFTGFLADLIINISKESKKSGVLLKYSSEKNNDSF